MRYPLELKAFKITFKQEGGLFHTGTHSGHKHGFTKGERSFSTGYTPVHVFRLKLLLEDGQSLCWQ